MRVLEDSILIHVALLLIVIIIFIVAFFFFLIKRNRSKWAFGYYGGFLFAIICLALQFLIETILDLEIERAFIHARNVFCVFSVVSFSMGFFLRRVLPGSSKGSRSDYSQLDMLLEKTENTIMIFDQEGHLIRLHDHGNQLGFLSQPLQDISQLIALKPEDIIFERTKPCSFILKTTTGTTVHLKITPIMKKKTDIMGFTAVLHNVTDYYRLLEDLMEKNQWLRTCNEKLLHEVEILEQFNYEKQRLRLIAKIQKELVNGIHQTIFKLNQMENKINTGNIPDKSELLLLSDEVNELYKKVRQIVSSIFPAKGEKVFD